MALPALETALAQALSQDALPVALLPLASGAGPRAALGIRGVRPRGGVVEGRARDEGDGRPRRVSVVTLDVALTVRAAGDDAAGRTGVVGALERAWWRAEAPEVRSGAAFGRDAGQGWVVEEVRVLAAQGPVLAEDGDWTGGLDLEIDARLWPADLVPEEGPRLRRIIVQLGQAPVSVVPERLRVAPGAALDLRIHLDVRHLLARAPAASPDLPDRRIRLVLVGPDEGPPLGSLTQSQFTLADAPLDVRYAAGPGQGVDRLEVRLRPTVARGAETVLGRVDIEVRG